MNKGNLGLVRGGLRDHARVLSSVSQNSTGSGAVDRLSYDTIRHQTDQMFQVQILPTKLVAKVGGIYIVSFSLSWTADADTNVRLARIYKNATAIADFVIPSASTSIVTAQSFTTVHMFEANDFVESAVYQVKAGTIAIPVAGNYSPELAMSLVKPAAN